MNRRKVNIGLFRKKAKPEPPAKPNGLHKVYFREFPFKRCGLLQLALGTVNPALTLEEIANITLQEKLKKLEQEKVGYSSQYWFVSAKTSHYPCRCGTH